MDKIMDELFQLAKNRPKISGARIVSAIVLKNKIIAYGFNQKKSHPFQKKYSKNKDCIYLHAEVDAIKNALREVPSEVLSKCTIYVARAKKASRNGPYVLGTSTPCSGCMKCIMSYKIGGIVCYE